MIVFVNGPFGVGKSTAVAQLHKRLPEALVIDPEKVGHMLWAQLPEALRTEEFELEPIWPSLTRCLIEQFHRAYRRDILVPMTIARPAVFAQLVEPLRSDGIDVSHITLLAAHTTIRDRLRQRGEGPDRWGELSWEGEQVERCLESLTRAQFAVHLETDQLTPAQVADAILRLTGLPAT
jgi:broad-specificity NMP kinase